MGWRGETKARVNFASSLPYSEAERRADALAAAKRISHAKAVIASCTSGQRYDLPFDRAAHRRLQRMLGERD